MQASDRESSSSLRMQALPASTHVIRTAPVVEQIHQHTGDGFLVHSAGSRAWRSRAEEVLKETAFSSKEV